MSELVFGGNMYGRTLKNGLNVFERIIAQNWVLCGNISSPILNFFLTKELTN